ncbi:MAG: hypothetical protein ACM3Q9_00360 [Methanosarcina sp.]
MAFPLALSQLETALLDGCTAEREWPARVAVGIYAGVDFAIDHPEIVDTLASDPGPGVDTVRRYESVIGKLVGFLRSVAPPGGRLPPSTDEALVAGMVGLVGDHLRIGRLERLAELKPALVLLTLLPYLGFVEAQGWADWADDHLTLS